MAVRRFALVAWCNVEHGEGRGCPDGYRHVVLFLRTASGWLKLEAIRGQGVVWPEIVAPLTVDIRAKLRASGYRAMMQVEVPAHALGVARAAFRNTSVGLVKTFLGITTWSVSTPWDLFRYLDLLRRKAPGGRRKTIRQRSWWGLRIRKVPVFGLVVSP